MSDKYKKLLADVRLAAKVLEDTNTFPTGQAILYECAEYIEDLEAQLQTVLRTLDWTEDRAKEYREQALVAEEAFRRVTTPQEWEDRPDELTEACNQSHPHLTKDYKNYLIALELVSNRYGKYALVSLVTYLLREIDKAKNITEK